MKACAVKESAHAASTGTETLPSPLVTFGKAQLFWHYMAELLHGERPATWQRKYQKSFQVALAQLKKILVGSRQKS